MHLQSSRRDDNGFEIKKPCCSPAAYRPLDILHLDQVGRDVDNVVVAVVVVDVDVDNDAFWPLDTLYPDQVGLDVDGDVDDVVDVDAFRPLDILFPQLILLTTITTGGGVLFSRENAKFWPMWAILSRNTALFSVL